MRGTRWRGSRQGSWSGGCQDWYNTRTRGVRQKTAGYDKTPWVSFSESERTQLVGGGLEHKFTDFGPLNDTLRTGFATFG